MSFLQEHPGLRPFLLTNVRPTWRVIGSGSYGSVEEVEIPGATCAAKKIHNLFQDPARVSREQMDKSLREFVRECQLMSTLRHPHIVHFLGVCFLPGSRVPALVMEKLETSLHDVLDPDPPPPTKTFIPLSLKCSILHNVASGLSFLHSHSPPIIHRDLSASNVLLTGGMVAKISDLGMARIVPGLRAATMTKAPGTSVYMPPEALDDESRYDVSIDVFSIGVLAMFVLAQTFPKPLAAAYMDTRRAMVGRTELERRDKYMQQIKRQLHEGHPFVTMIQKCLSNVPEERPTADGLLKFLEEARVQIGDSEFGALNKLLLIQVVRQTTELLRKREKVLQHKMGEIHSLNQQMSSLEVQAESQKTKIEQLQRKLQVYIAKMLCFV